MEDGTFVTSGDLGGAPTVSGTTLCGLGRWKALNMC